MPTQPRNQKARADVIGLLLLFLALGLILTISATSAQSSGPAADSRPGAAGPAEPVSSGGSIPSSAACPTSRSVDGVALNECVFQNFTVGGVNKSVTVYYTKQVVTATRTVDGNPVSLTHWINSDAQAQNVALWGEQAWEQYHSIFNHHPYDTGCNNNINVSLEQGVGWAGIAWWASPGSCWIGIDAPMIRGGGADGQEVVYHEFQHYLQYSYNNGCYASFQPGYPGNSEYIEGYADLASDAVDASVDSWFYNNAVADYDPRTSFFDKGYYDVWNKYYIEQLGTQWRPPPYDPRDRMDALRRHYEECDTQDSLYVLDSLIPTMSGGQLTHEKLFLNFFAANWAKDWASATTQPELVYTDDDANPYGTIYLAHDVNLSSSQSWPSETTPDDWAANYYQVRPQTGCSYATLSVTGASGARLGINLMAAHTSAPASVVRGAWIGKDFTRTFPGAGSYDRMVAIVNAFAHTYNYGVSFTCVSPSLDLLEPRPRPNSTQVGAPASPIAFLARWNVTSGGAPVRGLPQSAFTADAEGGAITFVAGSFQEVGDEYWATMLPPTKPAGTTYVDMRLCLNSSICDTHNDALLYVAPGNTDFALLFDASGSMNTEDVLGEGKRVDNAKRAGNIIAGLLQNGDRILVKDFAALDSPLGCGLPGGSGNCTLDLRTYLARTDVTVPGTINSARTAIGNVTARTAWTPIGAGLSDAKNALQASPYSLNPKVIVLLSDGEENVNPLYNAVKSEIIASGTVVDTVGLGLAGQVGEATLAQIAADTGGTFRFVPTTPGTTSPLTAQQRQQMLRRGVPQEIISQATPGYLPGPLALDNVYDYFETRGQGATRLYAYAFTGVADYTYKYATQYVDASATSLRLVVATKQPSFGSCNYFRYVYVLPPGADSQDGWISINPLSGLVPANWDVRNATYDTEVIITNPTPGTWQIRSRMTLDICGGGGAGGTGHDQLTAGGYDFLFTGSAQSVYHLEGRFLPPIVDNQGRAGDVVPIVATLLSRTGGVPNALVIGMVERPGRTDWLWLVDDGKHSDGAAGDGIYGALYGSTDAGGAYNVTLYAWWDDPLNPGHTLSAQWMGGFSIAGVGAAGAPDSDGDGMPDWWEVANGLNPNANDASADTDLDGVTNIEEFRHGTSPVNSDTDGGGESDFSEIANFRNPVDPSDDALPPLPQISLRALNTMIRITWAHPAYYDNLWGAIAVPPNPPLMGSIGHSGVYTATGLTNGTTYYLVFWGVKGTTIGGFSDVMTATPKADPDAPSGFILINDGAQSTMSKDVILDISATDTPLPGMPSPLSSPDGGPLALAYDSVSGGVQMKISNDPGLTGAAWEPLAATRPWTLGTSGSNLYRVYARFRDAAGNESFIVYDSIQYIPSNYLPLILHQAP